MSDDVTGPLDRPTVALAGDLRGHLVGTVSTEQGRRALAAADVEVSGATPNGPWARTARTDDAGLFRVALPLGTAGPIRVRATDRRLGAEASVDAGDLARGLTPRPADPAVRLSLEGDWELAVDPPSDFAASPEALRWRPIAVPSHWEMAGFRAESGLALYRKTVAVPAAWSGKRIKLRSEGVYSRAELWLNGRRQGGHDGGASPFELDLTDAARPGQENVLLILVADRSDAADLDAMSYYAHLNLGGVWRPLELFAVEPTHVSRLAVQTWFDAAYRDATLSVGLTVANERAHPADDVRVALSLRDPAGREIALPGLSATLSLGPWEERELTLSATVEAPEQWNAERPRLYTLAVALAAPGQARGLVEERVGFRQVEIRGRTYLLNGRPVKLWGACRHDAHPLHGRAITAEVARRDGDLMKGANLNAFRASHYPPHPAALEYADEHGLYVEDEAPLCFVGVGYGPEAGRTRAIADDLRLAPLAIGLTSALVERDRNHPSVVVWSQCNESKYGRIFALAREFLRTCDPTRPISAGQSANLDLATYHCPTTMKRLRDTADFTTPVLFDEAFPVFQGFGAQAEALELDPGLRDYWVTAHFEPVEALLRSEHQFGAIIWAWVDDAFLVPGKGSEYGRRTGPRPHFVDRVYDAPGRGIKGDPPWGLVDGWRRPRPEWWLAKKLFSPIQVDESALASPRSGEPISVGVENRNSFVGLAAYRCRWRLNGESGELRPDVAPGSRGVLRLATADPPAPGDRLVLEFFDERDRLVDAARLTFGRQPDGDRSGPVGRARVVEEPTELTFASVLRLVAEDAELAFDRTSGALVRALAGRQQVLRRGPDLHLMRIDAPLEPCPRGWILTGATHRVDGDEAVLGWEGRYDGGFEGGFEVRLDGDGRVAIAYRFGYSGPELVAREVGLSLDLPLACDRLEWERRAEWSFYPDDHIGRPRGVARAHPGAPQDVPPGERPFALDDHPWGCNDFRSAKRSVRRATLTDPRGAGVEVHSDGRQHVRATVQVHAISLKVLDHYGGAGTGRDEWDGASYGRGRIVRPGDVLEGVVKLRLLGADGP